MERVIEYTEYSVLSSSNVQTSSVVESTLFVFNFTFSGDLKGKAAFYCP